MKYKKVFKRIGTGAKRVGSSVVSGAGLLIKKAKEAQSPEAQEKRLIAQENRLKIQARIAQRRARIAKLQPKGNNMFGGLQGFDMGNVFGGYPKSKSKGKKQKPFDPFSQF
jgi:hypothetical protein